MILFDYLLLRVSLFFFYKVFSIFTFYIKATVNSFVCSFCLSRQSKYIQQTRIVSVIMTGYPYINNPMIKLRGEMYLFSLIHKESG